MACVLALLLTLKACLRFRKTGDRCIGVFREVILSAGETAPKKCADFPHQNENGGIYEKICGVFDGVCALRCVLRYIRLC